MAGKPRNRIIVQLGTVQCGVRIGYVRSLRRLQFDDNISHQVEEVTLRDFLSGLGISLEDCRKALEEDL